MKVSNEIGSFSAEGRAAGFSFFQPSMARVFVMPCRQCRLLFGLPSAAVATEAAQQSYHGTQQLLVVAVHVARLAGGVLKIASFSQEGPAQGAGVRKGWHVSLHERLSPQCRFS